MDTQKEMYAANVRNWLMDLATGVKAAQKSMQFAPAKRPSREWEVTATCYNQFEDGCSVHDLKGLAEAIGITPKFEKFSKDSFYYPRYAGYWYIELFGVKFSDLSEEDEDERK